MSWVRGVAWGKPDIDAHELALRIAQLIRGQERACALVAATDGSGGAFVDGRTWDAIADAERALDRAGAALHAVGAALATGWTGVDYGLVAIIS
jgi:glycerate-2-kinase